MALININKTKRAIRKVLTFVRGGTDDQSKIVQRGVSQEQFQLDLAKYEEWRTNNPSRSFKDYYSQEAQKLLASGSVHSTCGKNLRSGKFEDQGLGHFKELVKLGLLPSDTCVDYGCGSLRIGQHVMRHLEPGRYWGLEIADWLLDEGRKLVSKSLQEEKRPQLRIISRESVREAAASKPNMVFSFKVLQHVHPTELDEYFENLMTMIGSSGQGIVSGKWHDGTMQYRAKGWAHNWSHIENLVSRLGGNIEVLEQKDMLLPLEGAGHVIGGTFRIRPSVTRQ